MTDNDNNNDVQTAPEQPVVPQFPQDRIELNDEPCFPTDRVERGETPKGIEKK